MFSKCSRKSLQIPWFCMAQRSKYSTQDVVLSENDNIKPEIHNRNPRNLEKLRIAWRPQGYHLDEPGREYWHKLVLLKSSRYLTAQLVHFSGKVVIEASTQDWAIKKQLYKETDTSAYENLARIFANRCIECGITEMATDIEYDPEENTKVNKFAAIVEQNGITLKEPPRFKKSQPWDLERPEKPWEVHE